ncbi:hypothetical protein [Acinetobacter sp. P1(2025)]|uniref:hypothetical protein n=1 Tax=Acinetobacter sp. P1(2025) TaxID=3446120 RepID=UPI003F53A77D
MNESQISVLKKHAYAVLNLSYLHQQTLNTTQPIQSNVIELKLGQSLEYLAKYLQFKSYKALISSTPNEIEQRFQIAKSKPLTANNAVGFGSLIYVYFSQLESIFELNVLGVVLNFITRTDWHFLPELVIKFHQYKRYNHLDTDLDIVIFAHNYLKQCLQCYFLNRVVGYLYLASSTKKTINKKCHIFSENLAKTYTSDQELVDYLNYVLSPFFQISKQLYIVQDSIDPIIAYWFNNRVLDEHCTLYITLLNYVIPDLNITEDFALTVKDILLHLKGQPHQFSIALSDVVKCYNQSNYKEVVQIKGLNAFLTAGADSKHELITGQGNDITLYSNTIGRKKVRELEEDFNNYQNRTYGKETIQSSSFKSHLQTFISGHVQVIQHQEDFTLVARCILSGSIALYASLNDGRFFTAYESRPHNLSEKQWNLALSFVWLFKDKYLKYIKPSFGEQHQSFSCGLFLIHTRAENGASQELTQKAYQQTLKLYQYIEADLIKKSSQLMNLNDTFSLFFITFLLKHVGKTQ